ncbi:MAG: hypothetical protein IKD53_04330, partial [Clostridia bacterium]|nr:hypothetical protein [Clostridia bacterium]
MKRWLAMILVFVLCLALPSVQASDLGPTEGTCGARLTWRIDEEGVLTIAGTGAMSDYSSDSGAPWELRKSAITKVVVGSGATSVGSYAFQ